MNCFCKYQLNVSYLKALLNNSPDFSAVILFTNLHKIEVNSNLLGMSIS